MKHFSSVFLSGLRYAMVLGSTLIFLNSCTPMIASSQTSISFQTFYDELSPYGRWIQNNEYGFVWSPNADAGFAPYSSNGYWVYTDAGWTWYSRFSWGWAPFHYGRWWYDSFYGWVWIPGTEWAPAWVSWCDVDDYYGWAPLPPGIQIDISFGENNWIPHDRWRFLHHRDMGQRNIENRYAGFGDYLNMLKRSRNISNFKSDQQNRFRYNAGPELEQVTRYSGNKVKPIQIQETRTKNIQQINNNRLRIFKPEVKEIIKDQPKPSPVKTLPWGGENRQQPAQVRPPVIRQEPERNEHPPIRQVTPPQKVQPEIRQEPPAVNPPPTRKEPPVRPKDEKPEKFNPIKIDKPIKKQPIIQKSPVKQPATKKNPIIREIEKKKP